MHHVWPRGGFIYPDMPQPLPAQAEQHGRQKVPNKQAFTGRKWEIRALAG